MVFLLSWLQAPLLLHGPCFLPAQSFHRARIQCTTNLTPSELSDCIKTSIEANKLPFGAVGSDPSGAWFRLIRFSDTLQFLSILTIRPISHGNSGSLEIESASTTCFPPWIPLCFLFQWFLFWLPFPDFGHNLIAARSLAEALVRSQGSGGLELGEIRVLEAGSCGTIARWPPIAALANFVSPQSRFFLAFIATPGALLAVTFAMSGIVKFS